MNNYDTIENELIDITKAKKIAADSQYEQNLRNEQLKELQKDAYSSLFGLIILMLKKKTYELCDSYEEQYDGVMYYNSDELIDLFLENYLSEKIRKTDIIDENKFEAYETLAEIMKIDYNNIGAVEIGIEEDYVEPIQQKVFNLLTEMMLATEDETYINDFTSLMGRIIKNTDEFLENRYKVENTYEEDLEEFREKLNNELDNMMEYYENPNNTNY